MVTAGSGLACQEVRGTWTVALHQFHLFTPSVELFALLLVEHDGLWILVHHLSHVSQNVLLGDDAQETPEHTGREINMCDGQFNIYQFQGSKSSGRV